MNVSTLQQFLRSLNGALNSCGDGMRVGQQLERACLGLEPFRALELDAFAAFLGRCDEQLRSGAVSAPSEFDLNPIQKSMLRFADAQRRLATATNDNVKNDLVQAQRELSEQLVSLMKSVGLSGKPKVDAKWADKQAERAGATIQANSLRELAGRIADPSGFGMPEIRQEMERLATTISAGEWKLLAAQFVLPPSTKGSKGVVEVLFKLTGHRPMKAKTIRKSAAVEVDAVKVAQFAGNLRQLLERAKTDTDIPDGEIDEQMKKLESLSAKELVEIAEQAGIEKPGRTAMEVCKRIRSRLTAGRRVRDQTAQ